MNAQNLYRRFDIACTVLHMMNGLDWFAEPTLHALNLLFTP